MSRVLAAIDNSPSAPSVLSAAAALARVMGASVQALHVRQNGAAGAGMAAEATDAAQISLATVSGEPAAGLVAATEAEDVVALVIGARARTGQRPAGRTALAVVGQISKPLVVVPPDGAFPVDFNRILVPHDATRTTAAAVAGTIELACAAGLEVVMLHVFEAGSLPLFDDQTAHETDAWVSEFRKRYCARPDQVRVELRTGAPSSVILDVAKDVGADLIALGWSQDLGPGRAAVVRSLLEHSPLPLLLMPVRIQAATGPGPIARARSAPAQAGG